MAGTGHQVLLGALKCDSPRLGGSSWAAAALAAAAQPHCCRCDWPLASFALSAATAAPKRGSRPLQRRSQPPERRNPAHLQPADAPLRRVKRAVEESSLNKAFKLFGKAGPAAWRQRSRASGFPYFATITNVVCRLAYTIEVRHIAE